MPENPEEQRIQNIDIRWLVDDLDRMRVEIDRCQSAGWPNGLFPPDRTRILDYTSDFRRRLEYVISTPIPDVPEAHGRYDVRVPAVNEVQGPDGVAPRSPEDVENDDLAQLLRQLEVYRFELVHAQSVTLMQGLIQTPTNQTGDVQRLRQALDRIENLVNHIGETQPSDRPESTPREAPVPPGR